MTLIPTPASSAYRKATYRILPLLALGYGAAYIDRVNISFAALQMNRDLHFSGTIYGLGAGIFFLSYAAFEVPSNLLLYRFGARRWLARIMVSWGLIAMGMVLVRTPLQFYVARFLLGFAEAGFFPGVMYYLTQWFPPDLRGRAVTRFYVAWPLSVVIMGMVAGWPMGLDGRLGLAGWQWLFIVEGVPPVLLGIVFHTLLPLKTNVVDQRNRRELDPSRNCRRLVPLLSAGSQTSLGKVAVTILKNYANLTRPV